MTRSMRGKWTGVLGLALVVVAAGCSGDANAGDAPAAAEAPVEIVDHAPEVVDTPGPEDATETVASGDSEEKDQ